MKVVWNGKTVAESNKTIMIEGRTYFPPESVNIEYLTTSKKRYLCYWKGLAKYYNLVDGRRKDKNVAWTYPRPTRLSKKILSKDYSDYVSFDYRVKTIE